MILALAACGGADSNENTNENTTTVSAPDNDPANPTGDDAANPGDDTTNPGDDTTDPGDDTVTELDKIYSLTTPNAAESYLTLKGSSFTLTETNYDDSVGTDVTLTYSGTAVKENGLVICTVSKVHAKATLTEEEYEHLVALLDLYRQFGFLDDVTYDSFLALFTEEGFTADSEDDMFFVNTIEVTVNDANLTGQVTRMVSPDGGTEYGYDANGNATFSKETDNDGEYVEYLRDFDANGNLTYEKVSGSDGSFHEDRYVYDDSGTVIRETYSDSEGNFYDSAYVFSEDGNGVVETSYDRDGSVIFISESRYEDGIMVFNATELPDGDRSETEYVYDEFGNYTETVTRHYDADGTLQSTFEEKFENGYTVFSKSTCYDGSWYQKSTDVDWDGTVLRIVNEDSDGLYDETVNEYDLAGNCVKVTVYNEPGVVFSVVHNEFDGDDLKKALTEYEDGSWVSEEFFNEDHTERVLTTYSDGSWSEVTWFYDENWYCTHMHSIDSDGNEETVYFD